MKNLIPTVIQSAAFVGQLASAFFALLADAPEHTRSLLILISIWCFGIQVGSIVAEKRIGGERR